MNPVILDPLPAMKVNVYELRERLESLLRELAMARTEHSWASALESKTSTAMQQCAEFKAHVAALAEMMEKADLVQYLTEQISEIANRLELAGEKQHRKVSVFTETQLRYPRDKALPWVIQNHPELLCWNRMNLDRVLRAERPDFVTFVEVPTAQIDNDLFEYLPSEIKDPLKDAIIQ